MLIKIARWLLIGFVRLLVGAYAKWKIAPTLTQTIYFANHSSHLDTLVVWAALPPEIRKKTRPVAAKDYWGTGRIKQFFALDILNAILIERKVKAGQHPLLPLFSALEQGDSLIIFPEGTRRAHAEPDEFKPGIYHLALAYPQVRLIPVYLDTLHRSMPKGTYLPVPLICTAHFGDEITLQPNETKQVFLERARQALLTLISRGSTT